MSGLDPSSTDRFCAARSGTVNLGDRTVNRIGYDASRLRSSEGRPAEDPAGARAVLRAVVDSGVNCICASDACGPYINQLIREALAPYKDDLVIVTEVGVRSGKGGDDVGLRPKQIVEVVHAALRDLGVDVLDVVILRNRYTSIHPVARKAQVTAMAELRQKGLVRHIGIGDVSGTRLREAQAICPIVCVKNTYFNVFQRDDDALVDDLARKGIPFAPWFHLFQRSPEQEAGLARVAARLQATPDQVALAWLLARSANIFVTPAAKSLEQLHEHIGAADVRLPREVLAALDAIAAGATPLRL